MTSHEIYRYRLATTDDASAIFAVLEEVAPEIPVRLDTQRTCIQEGIGSGNAWIALDRDNQVVGFLMAEPDREALELSYGGVRTSHREHHIFPTLVKKMMAKGVPLTATVMHSNESNTVNRLLKLDFTKVSPWLKNDRDFLRAAVGKASKSSSRSHRSCVLSPQAFPRHDRGA